MKKSELKALFKEAIFECLDEYFSKNQNIPKNDDNTMDLSRINKKDMMERYNQMLGFPTMNAQNQFNNAPKSPGMNMFNDMMKDINLSAEDYHALRNFQ